MFAVIALMLIVDAFIIVHFQSKIDQEGKVLSVTYDAKSSIEELFNISSKIFSENEFDVREESMILNSQVDYQIDLLSKGGKSVQSGVVLSTPSENSINLVSSLHDNWKEAQSTLSTFYKSPIRVDSSVLETIVFEEFIDSTFQESSKEITRVILVPNPEIKKTLSQFSSHKKLLWRNLDELAVHTISEYSNFRSSYHMTLLITLIGNLLVVVMFVLLMIKEVVTPLSNIGHLTGKLANGEDVELKYNKADEIGEIVTSVKSLGNHLRQASDFVHQIGEGNLEVTLSGLSEEQDKEGSLAHSLIAMQEKLKVVSQEDAVRNWTTQGVAKFAEILRVNNTDLESLGDAILSELISYTSANMGCIYVPIENDGSLQLKLIAFNAYDQKKFFNETIEIGDGIIGQTFVEKKTTYLREIPEEYAHVKTGTGSSMPKTVIIVPLQVNEEVYGVLEMASLDEFSQDQIGFIESVGETIAGTIYNVKNAEQTKILLEDSQQLTEQMRAQEEEMRQNMEELSATQEEVARKEHITASTIKAFDQAVATIQFNEDGVITDVNNSFSTLSQKSKSYLLGKELKDIVRSDEESLSNIIDQIFNTEESRQLALEVITDNGSISISASISTLQSNNAILIGYVNSGESSKNSLENELVKHLAMTSTTQEILEDKLNTLQNALCYFEVDDQLIITNMNSRAKTKYEDIKVGNSLHDIKFRSVSTHDINDSLVKNGSYQALLESVGKSKVLLLVEQNRT